MTMIPCLTFNVKVKGQSYNIGTRLVEFLVIEFVEIDKISPYVSITSTSRDIE